MTNQANNHVSLCLPKSQVHFDRYYFAWIIKSMYVGMFVGKLLKDQAGIVRGQSISNKNFCFILWIILIQNSLEVALNILRFIANWDESGDKRNYFQVSQLNLWVNLMIDKRK